MLDSAPSALEFKNASSDKPHMLSALRVEERIHEVKIGVADLFNENEWRPTVRKRFSFVPLY